MSKRANAIKLFKQSETLYRCPLCGTGFTITDAGSFLCGTDHCFDLSSKGYINFVPNQKATHYGRELFVSRRRIFESHFYDPVVGAIKELIAGLHFDGEYPLRILDTGCGEGFYSSELQSDSLQCFGIDLSKEAILLAAAYRDPVNWIVANLSSLPFVDHSMDLVLNILTPANYTEFRRILKPGGILIKAIPGSDYLKEIRHLAAGKLNHEFYSNQKVTDYLEEHLKVRERKHLAYTLKLSKEQANDFLIMTPMTFNIEIERLESRELHEITIDLEIIAGYM